MFHAKSGVALTSDQQENACRHRFKSRLKLVGCSGLTSLLMCFFLQSYDDGVWLREGAQCSLL